MREAAVHNGGSRLERPRVAEGGPHEQNRVDATIGRWSGGNASRGLLCDSQESQPLNLAQTLALRARQLRLARQHVDNGRDTWEGETGLALFVEEAKPTVLSADTDAMNAMPVGHDAIPADTESSTPRKKADISLHFVGEDVTISSPSSRYDAMALH